MEIYKGEWSLLSGNMRQKKSALGQVGINHFFHPGKESAANFSGFGELREGEKGQSKLNRGDVIIPQSGSETSGR